jgi:hypothetical protein
MLMLCLSGGFPQVSPASSMDHPEGFSATSTAKRHPGCRLQCSSGSDRLRPHFALRPMRSARHPARLGRSEAASASPACYPAQANRSAAKCLTMTDHRHGQSPRQFSLLPDQMQVKAASCLRRLADSNCEHAYSAVACGARFQCQS